MSFEIEYRCLECKEQLHEMERFDLIMKRFCPLCGHQFKTCLHSVTEHVYEWQYSHTNLKWGFWPVKIYRKRYTGEQK